MKKIIVVLLAALMFSACACSHAYINEQGQRVKPCTTDYECERVNGF